MCPRHFVVEPRRHNQVQEEDTMSLGPKTPGLLNKRTLSPRCPAFWPGLRSMPWWEPTVFPEVSTLEENFQAIRSEFLNILLCGQLRLHPQSEGGPRKQITEGGDWNIFDIISHGQVNATSALLTPTTARLLAGMPGLSHPNGLAYFSVVNPGMRVTPHRGPTNSRLRIHLGLRIPAGAVIRVGDEWRSWQEGRCLVFDDSWEHEVSNKSEFLRAVLLVDTWHPDLTAAQRSAMDALRRSRGNGATRRKQRGGWTKSSDKIRPWSLRSLVGTEHLGALVAAITKAKIFNDEIFLRIGAFVQSGARESERTESPRPFGDGNAVGHELWAGLASLVAPQKVNISNDDVVDLIHVCSAYWRWWFDAEMLTSDRAGDSARSILSELHRLKGAAEILRWCVSLGEGGPSFGDMAPLVVVAIHGLKPDSTLV
jgi:aspartyl/asparaginyl beta-hydroxylase (cupin superfamily)